MIVIIAGSRDLLDPSYVEEAVWASGFQITEIVSGCARGVDTNGEFFARKYGIPVTRMPAQWRDKDGVYNARAGHERNERMAAYAEGLVAVWDGASTGTKDMITRARKKKLPVSVHVVTIDDPRK